MLERIHHRLTGWAAFSVTGDPARFLTLTARRGISLWGFDRREGRAVLRCRPGDYKKLRPLARRGGVRLRLEARGGLPFRVRPLWRRPGLLAGIPLALGLFWFLSGFVWGVRVTGTETLGEGVILRAAADRGVAVGVGRGSFVPKVAAHGLVGDLPQLEWAAVNTDGCFAEVAVREGAPKPEIADDGAWSNIIAGREGTVVAIEAERGRPEVTLGQTVEAGDLLIAGLFWEKLDPWSPSPAPLRTLGAARGRVLARTYREFTVHVSGTLREQSPTGEEMRRPTLEIFGQRLSLGPNPVAEGPVRVTVERRSLRWLGVELPLALEWEITQPLEERTRTLSQGELRTAALWKLRRAQREDLAPGSRVDSEELEWAFPDGMCLLTARCRCVEDVALEQKVLVKETEDPEIF